jgi:acyl carrier protein
VTVDDVEHQLRLFLIDELGVPAELLDADVPLLEGGLIDSLGVVSLVAFCEEELACAVPAEEIAPDAFESLGSLVEAVTRWRQA